MKPLLIRPNVDHQPEVLRRDVQHAAQLISLPPSACVFVDDVAANITAAEACGMTGGLHVDPVATTDQVATLLGFSAF